MIETVSHFDKRTAAGILARMALALEDDGNPAASATLADEYTIRHDVLNEVRKRLGIALDDNRPETIEKVADYLDAVSEELLDPPDTRSALERLAEHGALASDLYEIDIIPNIQSLHGKNFPLEQALIERTIKTPDREQHFGPPAVPTEPFLISLFYKNFQTPWPFKNFAMLVAGQRDKLTLNVHQAWRLYGHLADIRGISLVDAYKRFADSYGYNIEIGGERGHFFLWTNKPVASWTRVDIKGPHPEVTFSHFTQNNPITLQLQSALVVSIDLHKYRSLLKQMEVRGDQIR